MSAHFTPQGTLVPLLEVAVLLTQHADASLHAGERDGAGALAAQTDQTFVAHDGAGKLEAISMRCI